MTRGTSDLFARIAAETQTPPCARCGEHPRKPGQRWCRECHTAYMREWRARHAGSGYVPRGPLVRLTAEQRRARVNARAVVKMALRRGTLHRGPCEVCGTTEDVHAHHDDYNHPRDVRWLCRAHHSETHGWR